MDPKDIMLNEITQTQREQILYVFTYIQNLKTKLIEIQMIIFVVPRSKGLGVAALDESGPEGTNFQL